MKSHWTLSIGLAAGLFVVASASAQTAAPTRGRLLYETHCVECHTTQMHWRDNQRVTDWASLQAQVRRWQGTAQLNWSDADIDAVARHLNLTIYRLPRPETRAAGQPGTSDARDAG